MRWPLLGALTVGLALLSTPERIGLQAQGFETLRAEDAAAYVRQATGRPAIIVFYATSCPRSRAMFPSLVALANQYQAAGVDFLVFSTDDAADVEQIPGFLAKYGAPFTPVYIEPWAPASSRALWGAWDSGGQGLDPSLGGNPRRQWEHRSPGAGGHGPLTAGRGPFPKRVTLP